MARQHIQLEVAARESSTPTLEVSGDLDNETSLILQGMLRNVKLQGNHHVALDLQRVRSVDSQGVRVIVRACEEYRATRGQLRIVRASDAVHSLFTLLRLDHMLPGDLFAVD